MKRLTHPLVPIVGAAVVVAAADCALGFVFTLTAVTNTTPNFAPPILIMGNVTVSPGETFYSPNVMSGTHLPFLPGFTAGLNGNGQTWDPGFLAWNGLGTYTGPIYNNQVSTNNLGYAGGMPLGLYNFNPLGPGGQQPALTLYWADSTGDHPVFRNYAINVVPEPGVFAVLGLGGLIAMRRRR